jgi:hypothetical protein
LHQRAEASQPKHGSTTKLSRRHFAVLSLTSRRQVARKKG